MPFFIAFVLSVFFVFTNKNQPPEKTGGWRLTTIQNELVRLILYIRLPSNHNKLEILTSFQTRFDRVVTPHRKGNLFATILF